MTSADQTGERAGTVFAEYLKGEMDAEESRRDSLEKRGLALVTVAGALVTLLLGLSSSVGPRGSLTSGSTRITVLVALAGFVVTAGCAVATNAPRRVRLLDAEPFQEHATGRWGRPADDARRTVFATRIQQLQAAQVSNDRRGALLLVGMASLGLAVLALAATVGVQIWQ